MPHTLKNAVHVPGMCGKPEKKNPGVRVNDLGKMWNFWSTCGMYTHNLLGKNPEQTVCVQPADAPEIPYCSRMFTWTPESFFLGLPHIPGTCTTFLQVCGIGNGTGSLADIAHVAHTRTRKYLYL